MARSKKTRALGDVAASVLKRADKAGRRHGALAVTAWQEVMGEDISKHTRGFALRGDRELVVFVDGAAWANQLSLMSEDLQNRLNTYLGEESVKALRFTVSRKVADEVGWEALSQSVEEFYETDTVDPVPLDDVERSQALQVAGMVKDPDLREAALKVMIKDLEQKKGARLKQARKGS